MIARTDTDVVIIGAGVVGLAVARALALAGRDVIVLEAEDHIGEHQSSRNSEVIHAGLYYTPGSLKARACVAGKERLYAYCAQHGIAHRRIGKFIVAANAEQVTRLEAICANARACGVDDLVMIDGPEVRRCEPALTAHAALISPSTGIIDSHAYMLALQGEAEAHGASVVFKAPFERAVVETGRVRLWTGGVEPFEMTCRLLVNCAGMAAPALARRIDAYPPTRIPQESLAKGNYFTLAGRSPFSRLIYPIPEPGGLGVHLTLDLGGQARFGPDVEWIETMDYAVDARRGERFYAAIRRYWPGLKDGALAPAYAGIRAKIGPRDQTQDFIIDGPDDHGCPGVLSLFGIESPGLTSSLALAGMVADKAVRSA
ncbi:MAG: NAD(P)/FAD-dependent oxidoreductase [Hyphomicrobiales bacterium]|nr:NAD(P)/FAD-dependent oxidoreductase [Hyphomicrobiales bacterium]OQW85080.1 MAG: FAD-dependent oxidoreductase [Proteobacteria bacterium ST_bin15]